MNKRLISIGLATLMALSLVACKGSDDKSSSAKKDNVVESTSQKESGETSEKESAGESTKADELFAMMSEQTFEFCSGAGGWAENFYVESDGSFEGTYHDSDMGDIGEGYENGTYYYCTYQGHFGDVKKIDDLTYEIKLLDIAYNEATGTQEIKDDMLYIYTESYALGGNDTFTVYLPGTNVSEFSESEWIWLQWMNEGNEKELTYLCMVDEKNEYGIYSYKRLTPLEDAQMTFNNYQYSYDYFVEAALNAQDDVSRLSNATEAYNMTDECLNYIWKLIKKNVDEEKFSKILDEQRAWLAVRDQTAEDAADGMDGYAAEVIKISEMAELTWDRCAELIEYLK